MAAPAGYVPLDLVGFTDKGAYVSESTYAANDIVHNDNKMYRSLQDNNTGHALPVSPETETEWWELWLSGGAEDLEAITVKDTSNVTGGGAGKVVVAQTLIDAIAQKVMNDLVAKSMIDNNLLGTDATHVLASPQGKALDEKITQLYSNIKWGTKIIYSVTVGANQEVSASFPASDFGLTTKPRAGFISVSNANCLIPIGYDYDNSTNEEIKFRLRSVTEINNMNIRASVLLLV